MNSAAKENVVLNAIITHENVIAVIDLIIGFKSASP